jgi:hypothetical protein
MTAMKLIRTLLRQKPQDGTKVSRTQEAAKLIAHVLLNESPVADFILCEASIHRPTRSRIWVACYTGERGGQVWRSTGLTDRDRALTVARRWEALARAGRAAAGRVASQPTLPVSRKQPGTGGPLTQKEVALLLKISERAVRLIERRAVRKLFNHPLLRQAWRQYLAGELDEDQWRLTQEEIRTLFHLARTPEEWRLLQKVIRLV